MKQSTMNDISEYPLMILHEIEMMLIKKKFAKYKAIAIKERFRILAKKYPRVEK